MRISRVLFLTAMTAAACACQDLKCDLAGYKPQEGLKAQIRSGVLEVTWQGERSEQLRAQFAIRGGQPMVQELAARKNGGSWIVLGRNLTPEFEVTSGVRRLSEQQIAPLRELKIALTPEVIEREKWNAFWDAPLMVPGTCRHQHGPAAQAGGDSARRGRSTTRTGCQVKTDGARIEVDFPGSGGRHLLAARCSTRCIAAPTCCGRRPSPRPASPRWPTNMWAG